MWLDDLTFRPLPETKPYAGSPRFSATSQAGDGSSPRSAGDGNTTTSWRSAHDDPEPQLTIDFGVLREFGGLVIDWDSAAYPAHSEVQVSDDGASWTPVRSVGPSGGRVQYISLPDSEARSVRLIMAVPSEAKAAAIRELEILPLEASQDPNAFAAEIARRSHRGYYPRALLGEGTAWTVVGAPEDDHEALISEDGAVEVDKRAFSIEPFLFVDGRLLTWAEATVVQALALGHAPVPTVTRSHDGLVLSVTAAADGTPGESALWLLYTVENTSPEPVEGSLLLAVRPHQVNPPYQQLNVVGGVMSIDRIAFFKSKRTIQVNDKQIDLGESPSAFGCASFDEGDVTSFMEHGQVPPHRSVNDPERSASAAMEYRFHLQSAESRSWALCVPFPQDTSKQTEIARPMLNSVDPAEYVRQRQQAVADGWHHATSTFDLLLPDEAADIADTIRSTLAYILINRDGPAIQPGSRSYERSWIRDGSLTATALLRFGLAEQAREFVEWYATHQFDSGKIPCVVDQRGPDPVPENDSHGQFIMAVMNVYRFTGDKDFLREYWPQVVKAVAYIDKLRAERMTAEYSDPRTTATHQEPNKPAVSMHAFYGLMPESISHEGYSAKPMHSYWDDFFTLRGLKDAAEMAHILGKEAEAKHYQESADDFARTLYDSIGLVMQTHHIDYLPGCVELGDFDATSTTVALWPCGELDRLPRPALDRTFDRYWERFVRRRDDPSFLWTDYTPYELRCVGSLVLLGDMERAHEALEFFLNDRLPIAWNQWPEVVHRVPHTARFIGDLPHTWCGSDFLNSVRMLFLYEREADEALVLLAGVPRSWTSSQPIGFKDMPTYGGRMSCALTRAETGGDRLVARIEGTCPVPRGGIRLTSPLGPATEATVNGETAQVDVDGRVIVRELPATVEMSATPVGGAD